MIYSIGYTSFPIITDFINVLKLYNIDVLIDVRSNPVASDFYAQFSEDKLKSILENNQICYRNYKEFGARQIEFMKNGRVDFVSVIKSPHFIQGVEKVKNIINSDHNVVLMCAEKNPLDCHRYSMVGQGLEKAGIEVLHIMSDGKTKTQQELKGISLFSDFYEELNDKIGYRGDR